MMISKLKFSVLLACCAVFAAVGEEARTITVDGSRVVTGNWIGNGVQWAAYPHNDTTNTAKGFSYPLITDAQLQRVMDRLDVMKPQFIRLMIHTGWRYFEGLDAEGNPIVNYENDEMKFLYRILDYCQSRKITVIYGEWAPRAKKVSGESAGAWVDIWPEYNAKWAKMIADVLNYLITVKGYTCIQYYDLENEPYGSWSFSAGKIDRYAKGLELLNQALIEKGLRDKIKLNCSWGSVEQPQKLTPEKIKRVAPFADVYDEHHYIHKYPTPETNWETETQEHLRFLRSYDPDCEGFFLGEFNFTSPPLAGKDGVRVISYHGQPVPKTAKDSSQAVFEWENGVALSLKAIQTMRGGILGLVAWQLDDSMHTQDDDGIDLKRWGFFDSMGGVYTGRPDLEELRPAFYTWTLMCRSFPKGMRILDTQNGLGDGISAVAGNAGTRWSVVLVNANDAPRTVKVKIANGPGLVNLKKYVYFRNDMPVDKAGYPVPRENLENVNATNGIGIVFPGKGFVLLEMNAN